MVAVPTKDPKETEKKLALRREAEERRKAAIERQRKLFDAIGEFVRERGGFLISPPGDLDLRVDIPPGSTLVDDLTNFGYRLRPCGINQRATPDGLIETQCFAFRIPG